MEALNNYQELTIKSQSWLLTFYNYYLLKMEQAAQLLMKTSLK